MKKIVKFVFFGIFFQLITLNVHASIVNSELGVENRTDFLTKNKSNRLVTPTNDNASSAFTLNVAEAPVAFSTLTATSEVNEPSSSFSNGISNTVWYKFTPTCADINIKITEWSFAVNQSPLEFAVYSVVDRLDFSTYTQVGYVSNTEFQTSLALSNLDSTKTYYIQVQAVSVTPSPIYIQLSTPNVPQIVTTQDVDVYLNETGMAAVSPNQVNNSNSDCSNFPVSLDINTFTCNDLGDNTVTLTITDFDGGNSVSNIATVTVLDAIAPEAFSKESIIIFLDSNGAATLTAEELDNGSRDNCSVASLRLDKTSFNCSDLGDNTVTLTVADTSGNEHSSTTLVQVFDSADPIVITKNISIPLDINNQAVITADDVDNGSTDNCIIQSRVLNLTQFNCSDLGPNTVTLTVTDNSGNVSSETAIVTILDNEQPIAQVKNISVSLGTTGIANITVEQINDGSSDNCSIASMVLDVTSFNCSNIGENTVTLTVTDSSGNIGIDTATVTVLDTLNPIVRTRNVLLDLDVNNQATISPEDIDDNSSDNCTIISRTLDIDSFNCLNIGENIVTLSITDQNNNVASNTAVVTVRDAELPIVNTKNITVYLDDNLEASITSDQIDNGSTDNCSIQSMELDITDFNCTTVGENTVTLTITDAQGNIASNTAVVTVLETEAPTVNTKNLTVGIEDNGQVNITASQIDDVSLDNCGIVSYVLDITSFDCSHVGENTVTLTVTDASGNTASKTAIVTVESNENPNVCCLYNTPFSENFDTTVASNSSNPNAPECWSFIADGYGWAFVSSNADNSNYFNHYELFNSSDASENYMLISPKISNLNTDGASINFLLKSNLDGTQFQVGTLSNPLDASTFTASETLTYNTRGVGNYDIYTVELQPISENNYIAIKHGNNIRSKIFLDNLRINTACFSPKNVAITNLTETTATITWDATDTAIDGYEWQLMDGENILPATTALLVSSGSLPVGATTLDLAGLMGGNTYSFYIKSSCNDDVSGFSDILNFRTSRQITLPLFEGFETTLEGSSSNPNAPLDWRFIDSGDGGTYAVNSTFRSKTGSGSYVLYNSSDTTGNYMLISPPIAELTSGGVQINFSADGFRNDFIEVGTLSNPEDPSTFSLIETLMFNLTSGDYVDFTANIPESSNSYFAIRHGQNSSNAYYYIDDINVIALPCIAPIDIVTRGITDTFAELSWDPTINAVNGYEWVVMADGEMPNVADAIVTGSNSNTDNSTNISGLNSNTVYDAYVRAKCESDSYSNWSTVREFRTLCSSETFPYIEDFETGVFNACWSISNTSEIFIDTNCSSNATNFLRINPGLNSIETSSIDVSGETEIAVSFDFFKGCNVDSDDSNVLEVRYYNGADWVLLDTLDTANLDSFWLTQHYIISSGLTHAFKLKFSGDYSYPFADAFSIDNLSVNAPPSCLNPQNLSSSNIAQTSVDLSWDMSTTETAGYEWIIMLPGNTPSSTNAVATGTVNSSITSATVIGLSSQTSYFAYVRALCDNTTVSNWSSPVSIKTLASAPENDNVCDAIALTMDATSAGDAYTTLAATAETNEPDTDLEDGINGSVWFTFVAPASGQVLITTDIEGGTHTDTEIAVYSASSCSDFSGFTQIGFDQDGGGVFVEYNSKLELTDLTPGVTYYIQVDSYDDDTSGTFGIEVINFNPPINDNVCDAIALTMDATSAGDAFTTFMATAETNEPDTDLEDGINGSVWFTFVAPASGQVLVTTDIEGGTHTDTEIAVYSASSCSDFSEFTQIGFNQDGEDEFVEYNSKLELTDLTPGVTYYIQVDSYEDSASGTFGIEVIQINPPINDNVCDAIALTMDATSAGDAYTTLAATAETNEPDMDLQEGINGSVWFTFVAPASGQVLITTDIEGGTHTDTEIAVYSASSCSDFSGFTQIGFNQDGEDEFVEYNSKLELTDLTPGVTYYIQVDSYDDDTSGTFGIEVSDSVEIIELDPLDPIVTSCAVTSLMAPTITNDDLVVITATTETVFPLDLGTTTITWEYNDNGALFEQTQDVTINADTEAPVLEVVYSIDLDLSNTEGTPITADMFITESSDNCAIESITLSKNIITCEDYAEALDFFNNNQPFPGAPTVPNTAVIITVKDSSGNETRKFSYIILTDTNSVCTSVSTITYYLDLDGDTFGSNIDIGTEFVSNPGVGYSLNNLDCNDTNAAINPNTVWYVGIDSDEDGFVGRFEEVTQCEAPDATYTTTQPEVTDCDDNDAAIYEPQLYYVDADGDGFGSSETEMLCESVAPVGYADNNLDCNDLDSLISEPQLYYVDNDGDGYGAGVATESCEPFPPSGYASNNEDCNDNDSNFQTPQLFYLDNDGDGYGSQRSISVCYELDPYLFYMYVRNNSDCNDNDPAIYEPQLYFVDADGDGFGSSETEMLCQSVAPVGYADNDFDCNDSDAAIYEPQLYYVDADGDGFGSSETEMLCESVAPFGYSDNDSDCNDSDPSIYEPQLYFVDVDGDGFGSSETEMLCESVAPFGYSDNDSDCNDSDPSIYESQLYFVDADGDGFGSSETEMLCESVAPVGYADNDSDCDDNDAAIYEPQLYYVDADGDGFGSSETEMLCESVAPFGYSDNDSDCDDTNTDINPNAEEILNNNIDDDCDPMTSDTTLEVADYSLSSTNVTPNPFNNSLKISLPSSLNIGSIQIQIFDLNGRVVFSRTFMPIDNAIVVSGLGYLEQAPYIIKITNKDSGSSIVKQLIKF